MSQNTELEKKLKWHKLTLTDFEIFVALFAWKHKLAKELEDYCDEVASADGYPVWEEDSYVESKGEVGWDCNR